MIEKGAFSDVPECLNIRIILVLPPPHPIPASQKIATWDKVATKSLWGSVKPQLLEIEKIQVKLGHYIVETMLFVKVDDYIILVKLVKEPIAKGRINFNCINQYQNSSLQSSESLSFEIFLRAQPLWPYSGL